MPRKSSIAIILLFLFVACFVMFKVFFVDKCISRDAKYEPVYSKNTGYVGDESCKKCHKTEHQDWRKSDHYMSMLLPSDSTVVGDFNNVTFTADGVTSRFFKKGNKFYINTEDNDGKNRDFEVKYIFGYKPLQQYLVQFPGGKLQVPRLSWDVDKKKWFNQYAGQKIASHDWLHWTENSQNWNTMCSSCHSTNLHKNYDYKTDTYKTSYSIINVSCESCHGPAKQHIDYVSGSSYSSKNKVVGSYLKLGKKTGQLEQILACAPCHARSSIISEAQIESTDIIDNYIPQIPSTEFFYADGQVKEEDYIYTSFLQSKMFSNGVKCSDCHNVHSTKLKRQGNQTCIECHSPKKYDTSTHTFHASGKGTECVNCHMPGKLYMGNDLRHDHSFRVPRPDLSATYGTPNACSNCHADKSNKVLAATIEKWYGSKPKYHFSDDLVPGSKLDESSEAHLRKLINNKTAPNIIKATAVFYLGSIQTQTSLNTLLRCIQSEDSQIRYRVLRSLANFPSSNWIEAVGPLLSDKVRAVRIAAADLYITIPREQISSQYSDAFSSAQKELKDLLEYQTDFAVGNVMMADYYLKLKDYDNAEKFYWRGLKKDSQTNYALLNLSVVYNMQGKNDKSLEVLEKAKKNDPKNDRIYYNLGLLYNEMNNKAEAEKQFAKAVELKSNNPRVYYNYGLMLNQKGKSKEAENILKKGIAISPSAPELYYALTFVYLKMENQGKVLETATKLKQLDPDNPEYQDFFRRLGL
ncbi:tetratricopeptide repeat protein [Flavobacterium sp. 90]|uniref:tetratricopeptide repeat protein n=1 Tax=Flavobacterium sp. 90 TaxID=2135622 RepID=UPI0010D18B85|nr:tetratricopeptide repeat protein [Flavobacterium sp. 90]TCK55124.1 tetratricopeptide repeat protein [Flavobacterium sp. 90]